jgi:hypothetical protein
MGNLCCSAFNPNASDTPPAHCVPPAPEANAPAKQAAPGGKANGAAPMPVKAAAVKTADPKKEPPKKESLAAKLYVPRALMLLAFGCTVA